MELNEWSGVSPRIVSFMYVSTKNARRETDFGLVSRFTSSSKFSVAEEKKPLVLVLLVQVKFIPIFEIFGVALF